MSKSIKRGKPATAAKAVRSAKGVKRASTRPAKRREPGLLDEVMAMLPFTEPQLQKGFTFAILGVVAAAVWMVASYAGVPQMAQQQFALMAGEAGFKVNRVQVRGVKRMNELKVYEIVLAEKDRAMPLVDLDAIRDDLTQFGWIADARVSRQLPDTLVVDIVERKPYAVLNTGTGHVLVDAGGHALEQVNPGQHRRLMQLSGAGAELRAAELTKLLEEAPALRPQVRSAEWIGNRRWNITFRTGQVLALPEGDERANAALIAFARMDGVNRLIGGRVTYFDLRAKDRAFFRLAPALVDDAASASAATPQRQSE